MNIVLGVTGSVAAIKTFDLARKLKEVGQVKIVFTKTAMHFITSIVADKGEAEFLSLAKEFEALSDEDEWLWRKIGDPVQHVVLRDWMDVLVIAPLTATTIAKMAHGIADNLLTSIWLAKPMNKPTVVAPAMNTQMWENPITQANLKFLKTTFSGYRNQIDDLVGADNFMIVKPVMKKLACGDVGIGAMAEYDDIVATVKYYKCAP
jgi:phosphopantothenoylcysteine decarboxylase